MSRNGADGGNVHRFEPRRRPPPPRGEPAFNAPWPPLALTALLIALHALLSFTGALDGAAAAFGLVPSAVTSGRVWQLLTHMGVHGFWAHAIMNAVALLAFGAPLARYLGERGRGPLLFFGFFLLCGLTAAASYVLLHPQSGEVLIGASGAVAGLMGAASRLLGHPHVLSGLRDRQVVGLGLGWLALNLVFAVLGAIPSLDLKIAWEAHLIGYAVGLLAIAPYARLTRAR